MLYLSHSVVPLSQVERKLSVASNAWKVIDKRIPKCNKTRPITIMKNGEVYEGAADITELFNNFFINQVKNVFLLVLKLDK